MKRTSKHYQGTIQFSDIGDMLWLGDFREQIFQANKILRKMGKNTLRVRLALRDPIEKKTVYNWRTGREHTVGYDFGGNVIGGINNARKADVYVYENYDRYWKS